MISFCEGKSYPTSTGPVWKPHLIDNWVQLDKTQNLDYLVLLNKWNLFSNVKYEKSLNKKLSMQQSVEILEDVNYIILTSVTKPFQDCGGKVVSLPKFLQKRVDESQVTRRRSHKEPRQGNIVSMGELQDKNHC